MRLDFHRSHRLLFGLVFLGFVSLSVVVAVAPALSLEARSRPLPGSRPLTPLERTGLEVYLGEGCVYCHTQQVRPLAQDTARYGRPSVPGDYARLGPMDVWRQAPRVLGTERTGPDLSDIGNRQPSAAWHYLHLYQPRAVTPGSIMPAFPWLFQWKGAAGPGDVPVPLPPGAGPGEGVVVATPRGRALVAYLLSLRQVPLAEPASTAPTGTADAGARLYETRCGGCHQPNGRGLSGVFPPLAGDPVVTAPDPAGHVEVVLFGLSGRAIGGAAYASPMPAWADQLSDDEVAAIVNHERSSWGNSAPPVTPAQVAEIRKRGPRDR